MEIKQIFLILTLSSVIGITIGLSLDAYAQKPTIPNWIKNDAELWSNGSISDKEFAMAIGWLVQHKIIAANIETNTDGTIYVADNLNIPAWIKNDAFWWSQDTISDADFVSAIEYMINNKIISFSQPSILSQIEPDTVVKTSPTAPSTSNTNAIQLQSKYGTYEANDNSDTYTIHTSWVLKSQNGVEHKTVSLSVTFNEDTMLFDVPVKDGVIQKVIGDATPGSYVFDILSIDGLPSPQDDIIVITIPDKNMPPSGNPTTVQTTPTVPNTGLLPQNTMDFSVPPQVVQEATSSSGATVHFVPSFTGPGGGSNQIILTCSPPDGSQFPLGSTTVTCTATDVSSQKTLKKSFTVIVRDTTSPAIDAIQPVTGALDDTGGIVYFTVSATDLVDGPIIPTCDHKSGDKFPIGVSIIKCTAQDSRGNHSSRSLQITITK